MGKTVNSTKPFSSSTSPTEKMPLNDISPRLREVVPLVSVTSTKWCGSGEVAHSQDSVTNQNSVTSYPVSACITPVITTSLPSSSRIFFGSSLPGSYSIEVNSDRLTSIVSGTTNACAAREESATADRFARESARAVRVSVRRSSMARSPAAGSPRSVELRA